MIVVGAPVDGVFGDAFSFRLVLGAAVLGSLLSAVGLDATGFAGTAS